METMLLGQGELWGSPSLSRLEGIWLQVPENSIYSDLKIRDLSFLPNEFGGKRLLMRVRDPMIRAPLSDKEAPARK